MKTKIIVMCSLVLMIGVFKPFMAHSQKEQAALAASDAWLSLVDMEKYAESWNNTSSYFKNAIEVSQWEKALGSARKPLGGMLSRKIISQNYTKTLPGAPDGEYVVIQYDTSFENKKSAIETVTPSLEEDGIWRVSGYYIK